MKMSKKAVSLICALVLVMTALIPAYASDNYIKFQFSDKTAKPGEEVLVDLTVSSGSGSAADGLLLYNMQYDSSVIEFVDFVSYGSLVTNSVAGNDSVNKSTKMINLGYSNPTVANGTICKVKVKIKSTAAGGTSTTLSMQASASKDRQPLSNITAPSCTITVAATSKPATSISVKSSTSLVAGKTEKLVATVSPSDTTDTVSWSSNNTAVATVNGSGIVTAVAPGTANITAKAGSKTAVCVVTVTCNHSLRTVEAKDSTCKDKGWDSYKECTKCHKLFALDGTTPIDAIPYRALSTTHTGGVAFCKSQAKCTVCGTLYGEINPDNHINKITLNAVVPTCTQDGYSGDVFCKDCEKKLSDGHIIKADGNHVDADGQWETDENVHWHTCGCGEIFDKETHESSDWIIDQAATVEEAGSQHKECKVCSKVLKTEEISKLTEENQPADEKDPPNTGDDQMLIVWIIIAIITACTAAFVGITAKKRFSK